MWGWLIELIGLIKLIMSIGSLVNPLVELIGSVGSCKFWHNGCERRTPSANYWRSCLIDYQPVYYLAFGISLMSVKFL